MAAGGADAEPGAPAVGDVGPLQNFPQISGDGYATKAQIRELLQMVLDLIENVEVGHKALLHELEERAAFMVLVDKALKAMGAEPVEFRGRGPKIIH